jgi:hypothetical protein
MVPARASSAAPSLTLRLDYVRMHPDITRIRLCVHGGGCGTEKIGIRGRSTVPAAARTRTRTTRPSRYPGTPDFGRLIPAELARHGPDGVPARISLTAYSQSKATVSASATLDPTRQLPDNRCELRGYVILAQFNADGTLGYYQFV